MTTIDCISDLHGFYPKLEGGDLLIIAGDLTSNDSEYSWNVFYEWLEIQSYNFKVVIGGNHDNNIEPDMINCISNQRYLCDSGTKFMGLKIWGSPWTKTFFPYMIPFCKAFTLDTDEELKVKWDLIPSDTNILITHCPPLGFFDFNLGSRSLRNLILSKERFPNLRLHCFGHIHECGGMKGTKALDLTFVNASIMNEIYDPINKPMRVVL